MENYPMTRLLVTIFNEKTEKLVVVNFGNEECNIAGVDISGNHILMINIDDNLETLKSHLLQNFLSDTQISGEFNKVTTNNFLFENKNSGFKEKQLYFVIILRILIMKYPRIQNLYKYMLMNFFIILRKQLRKEMQIFSLTFSTSLLPLKKIKIIK